MEGCPKGGSQLTTGWASCSRSEVTMQAIIPPMGVHTQEGVNSVRDRRSCMH